MRSMTEGVPQNPTGKREAPKICPFALPADVKVSLDVSLRRFETVFPAAGSDASAVELSCRELERCCGANFVAWVDVCKAWQTEGGQ